MTLAWRVPMRQLGRLLGRPGAIGAALIGLCLALYFALLQPAQQRLESARLRTGALNARIALAGRNLHDAAQPVDEQLAAFYRIFPSEHESTDWAGKIAAIAGQAGLELQQADYKVSRDRIGRLTRFRMSLPLSGDYPRIRGFISDLHREMPTVSLEQVQFARRKVGDLKVDAKLTLVIFLENG
ncbi:MAG: GspMb/PilO family protein [Hyphomicrobiaceae bacterium]